MSIGIDPKAATTTSQPFLKLSHLLKQLSNPTYGPNPCHCPSGPHPFIARDPGQVTLQETCSEFPGQIKYQVLDPSKVSWAHLQHGTYHIVRLPLHARGCQPICLWRLRRSSKWNRSDVRIILAFRQKHHSFFLNHAAPLTYLISFESILGTWEVLLLS